MSPFYDSNHHEIRGNSCTVKKVSQMGNLQGISMKQNWHRKLNVTYLFIFEPLKFILEASSKFSLELSKMKLLFKSKLKKKEKVFIACVFSIEKHNGGCVKFLKLIKCIFQYFNACEILRHLGAGSTWIKLQYRGPKIYGQGLVSFTCKCECNVYRVFDKYVSRY